MQYTSVQYTYSVVHYFDIGSVVPHLSILHLSKVSTFWFNRHFFFVFFHFSIGQ